MKQGGTVAQTNKIKTESTNQGGLDPEKLLNGDTQEEVTTLTNCHITDTVTHELETPSVLPNGTQDQEEEKDNLPEIASSDDTSTTSLSPLKLEEDNTESLTITEEEGKPVTPVPSSDKSSGPQSGQRRRPRSSANNGNSSNSPGACNAVLSASLPSRSNGRLGRSASLTTYRGQNNDARMYATSNLTPNGYTPAGAYYYAATAPNGPVHASHMGHPISAYVGTPHVQTGPPQLMQHSQYSSGPPTSYGGQRQNGGYKNGYTMDNVDTNQGMSSNSTSPQNGVSDRTSRTNLYIKGLSEDFTDQRLFELVPDAKQVKSVKAATEDSNKCRGYGFIDFHTEDAAQAALKYIQQNFESYTCKFAKENEKDKTNLYVTNIPKSWTTKDSERLKDLFEQYGQIQSAFIMLEKATNRPTGVGFVRFANEDDAQRALDGMKGNPTTLPGCSAPVEAKYADKHNPETRRRRNNQVNGGLRTGLITSNSQFPLLPTASATSYAQSVYAGLYNPSLYRQNATLASPAAASPYSSYPLYQTLTGQSLINNLYVPVTAQSTVMQNAAALQALQGHANGADGSGLSSSFPHQFIMSNGLTSPAAFAAYAPGLEYANASALPFLHAAAQQHVGDQH